MANTTFTSVKPAQGQSLQSGSGAGSAPPDSARLRHIVESQQFTVPLLMKQASTKSLGFERLIFTGSGVDVLSAR